MDHRKKIGQIEVYAAERYIEKWAYEKQLHAENLSKKSLRKATQSD